MPHVTFEVSDNLPTKDRINDDLLKQCHVLLAAKLPTTVDTCKSRVIELNHYYLGDGDKKNAMVHITLKVLAGRTQAVLNDTVHALLDLVGSHLADALGDTPVDITCELVELSKDHYFAAG